MSHTFHFTFPRCHRYAWMGRKLYMELNRKRSDSSQDKRSDSEIVGIGLGNKYSLGRYNLSLSSVISHENNGVAINVDLEKVGNYLIRKSSGVGVKKISGLPHNTVTFQNMVPFFIQPSTTDASNTTKKV